mmetsp:Transcript_6822/g.9633  ORF Transcript_6822/g.9633 Transcript_6822/m.9633 type:complete len:271 (+) Transcript_6822:54-866(+)
MAYIPPSLSQLLAELRIKASISDDTPSLAGLILMSPDEKKEALQMLGLKRVSHKSKLRKRIEQLEKVLSSDSERAFEFYSKMVETSKGEDFTATLKLSELYRKGEGTEADEKKALELEIQAKCSPKYGKKMKKYLIDAVKVDGAYASTYNIRVIFKNEKGEKVEVIERGTQKLPDGIHVQDVIDLSVMPILKKLGWKRKFLWCKHERITASTQLCDIAYQAKSGELVLDCTNVDKIPEKPEPEVSEECIICFEENDGKQYLDCMVKPSNC